jgi:tetratricopeptide (TPR) repeat protein
VEALTLIEAGGDLFTLSSTLNSLAVTAAWLGRMEESRRYAEQALLVAERMGNPSVLCFVLGTLGEALLYLGEWQEARRVLQQGVPLLGTTGRGPEASLWADLGQLALREGDWEEASHSLVESVAAAEETGYRQMREIAQAYLAELDVLDGRPEEAIKRLEPLVKGDGAEHGSLLPLLAWAHLCIDDAKHIQQAAEVAERAVIRVRREPCFLAEALWIKGMVLIRQGRYEGAERVLREGLALARSMPFPYAEARILVQMADVHKQRGEQEQAREQLEEALTIFRRLGARKDIERTEEMLGRR